MIIQLNLSLLNLMGYFAGGNIQPGLSDTKHYLQQFHPDYTPIRNRKIIKKRKKCIPHGWILSLIKMTRLRI